MTIDSGFPDEFYPNDLDNQSAGNYVYDASGNMIKDAGNGITTITWSPTHKPLQVTKNNGITLKFTYDGNDNRARQTQIQAGKDTLVTIYFRDASGNVEAIYKQRLGPTTDSLWLVEQPIYGASRLGVIVQNKLMATNSGYRAVLDTTHSERILGQIHYELTDHLGNVLAVVTDEKLGHDINHDGTVDFYDARVIEAHDYYAFGMEMPGRGYLDAHQALYGDITKYRFGFNGKELNPSWGNDTYDYGFRAYSAQIARFMSVDPLTAKYPELTPYQFASNTPIWGTDLDGREVRLYTETHGTGHTLISIGKANNMVTYDFGRWGKVDWHQIGGEGVMLKRTGIAANVNVADVINNGDGEAFEINGVNESKVKAFFENIYNRKDNYRVDKQKNKIAQIFGKVIKGKNYNLFMNNCTTMSCEAVKVGGVDEFKYQWNPRALQGVLETSKNARNVTEEAKSETKQFLVNKKDKTGSSVVSSGSSGGSSGWSQNVSSSENSSSGRSSGTEDKSSSSN